MIHCFYHNDMDGHCAGAIVKMKYPDAIMHEMKYGYDFEKDVLPHLEEHHDTGGDNDLYIVDFRFTPAELERLVDDWTIHWCDHHDTGLVEAAQHPELYKHVQGNCASDKAGCELTWEYLHPGEPMPLIVHHVGRWDMWDHSDPSTIPFNRGLQLTGNTDPVNADAIKLWTAYMENSREGKRRDFNELDALLNMGLTGEAMKAQYDSYIGKEAYYIPNWEGYRTVALNSKVYDSYVVFEHDEKWQEHNPEVLVWYYQNGTGQWKHSVRAYPGTNTPVVKIAEKYSGGGRETAAGFTTDEQVVFPKPEENNE